MAPQLFKRILISSALLLQHVASAGVAFTSALGNHAVLQQAPAKPNVWGIARPGAVITVTLRRTGASVDLFTVEVVADTNGHWNTALPSLAGGATSYQIFAKSGADVAMLDDILFGDVYICGGQSNMMYSVGNASNASAEIAAAKNFPLIRVMTVGRVVGDPSAEQQELSEVWQTWAVAGPESIGGPWGSNFSAVCWFFGRDMHLSNGLPVGLLSVNWGATTIETWMSSDALAKCPSSFMKARSTVGSTLNDSCGRQGAPCLDGSDCCPTAACVFYQNPPIWPAGGYCDGTWPTNEPSALWNTMIHPLLRMAIKGVIWYQGESDAQEPLASNYHCTFPAMISDWRKRWHAESGSDLLFPFGFVQLAPWGLATSGELADVDDPVAVVRWGQTANVGYVPNAQLPNTFMAVAIDLGSFEGGCCAGLTDGCNTYPSLCIHPKWKQLVARRLSLGAQAVVNGGQSVCFQGPRPSRVAAAEAGTVNIVFETCAGSVIELRRNRDFDVLLKNGSWVLAQATDASDSTVVLAHPHDGSPAVAVRYLWSRAPCNHPYKIPDGPGDCSVYDIAGLPAAPFMTECRAEGLIV